MRRDSIIDDDQETANLKIRELQEEIYNMKLNSNSSED